MFNKIGSMIVSAIIGVFVDEIKQIKKELDLEKAKNAALKKELADNKARADKYEKIIKDLESTRDDRKRAEDDLMG